MVVFSLFMTLLLTSTMMIFGTVFLKKPPKEINALFGYRTRMSSVNAETWYFAHRYAGEVWVRTGITVTAASMLLILLLKNSENFESYMLILFYLQMASMLMVIPLTEKALRKRFDKEGNRLQQTSRR
ncbi:SdpI family protein [Proteiniclasticum sp. C24MP]|uniref:SdpI family protein n=1 Tax=Proteiniclasticum sp. C24MP TaxID=3374101 RepID=UPI003754EC1B